MRKGSWHSSRSACAATVSVAVRGRGCARRRRLEDPDDRSLRAAHIEGAGDCRSAEPRCTSARRSAPATRCAAQHAADKVVVFIHGAGTPAEVAFDVPYKDYSWMAVSCGRRVRHLLDGRDRHRPVDAGPWPMNDPCNLTPQQQAPLDPTLIAAPVSAGLSEDAHDDRATTGTTSTRLSTTFARSGMSTR